MSMCSLTAPVEELYGFEPGIDPRIFQIYRILKKSGVGNPYGEIVRTAATYNANRLVKLYQEYKHDGDLSLGDILATASLPFGINNYPTKNEFDQFAQEFKNDYAIWIK